MFYRVLGVTITFSSYRWLYVFIITTNVIAVSECQKVFVLVAAQWRRSKENVQADVDESNSKLHQKNYF